MTFQTNYHAPNTVTGEYCPDFPGPCICPIEPQHQLMPVHSSPCGHCEHQQVLVPHTASADMTTEEIVKAGGGHCSTCGKNLCVICEDQDSMDRQMACVLTT